MKKTFVFLIAVYLPVTMFAQIITTFAGDGISGYAGNGVPATAAELGASAGMSADGHGNVYIADAGSQCIRMVTTSATLAEINSPNGVATDSYGDLFFADAANQRIRMVNASGIISTIAGNGDMGYNGDDIEATAASLQFPNFVAADNSGNIYISDNFNYRARRLFISDERVPGLAHPSDNVSIYPNPCNGNFYINVSSQAQENASIIITNSIGQVVKEIYAPTNEPIAVKMDEPDGIYLLHATTIFGSWCEKIVLVK